MNFKFYNKFFSILTSSTLVFSLCGCSNRDNSSSVQSVVSSDVTSTSESSNVVTSVVSGDVTSTSESSSVITSVVSLVSTTVTSTDYVIDSTFTSSFTTSDVTTDFTDNFDEFSTSSSVISDVSTFSGVNDQISTSTVVNDDDFTENDLTVLDYFKEVGSNIKNYIDSEELLDKGKVYFVYCVDFLFYDAEIKGIKFNDLTDGAKQQLLSDISEIDALICTKFPNYKETISSGSAGVYNKASEIIKDGSKNIKDFSRDKLGDENYSKLEQYKDLFMEQTNDDIDTLKDLFSTGKAKIKDWYENWRAE